MANITLMGASYTDVPAIDLPQTGGGTVRFYENGGGSGGGDDWEYTWEYESGSAIIPLFMTGTATDETDSLLIVKPQLTLPFSNGELEVVAKMGVTVSSLPQLGAGTSVNAGFKVFFQADTGYVRSNVTGSFVNYTSDNGFHKIKMKWQNGTATLYVDDVQVASGSGGTSANFSGIGAPSSTNMNASASMYIKSIKYRRL